jgi:hypothetical protein
MNKKKVVYNYYDIPVNFVYGIMREFHFELIKITRERDWRDKERKILIKDSYPTTIICLN